MSHQLVLDDLLIDMDISLVRRLNLQAVLDNAISMGIADTVAAFCKQKNVDPSYISQLTGGHRNIGERSARNLEKQLDLKPGDLDKQELNFGSDSNQIGDNSHKNLEIAKKIGYQLNRWVPVKVYSRMDVNGIFTETDREVNTVEGYVPSLTASSKAYSIKSSGGANHPAIRDGWYVVCDPDAQPVSTEYVHITLTNGQHAIKEYISKAGNLIILQSVSDGSRITYDNSEVESITAIIDIVPPSRHMAQIPVMSIKNID